MVYKAYLLAKDAPDGDFPEKKNVPFTKCTQSVSNCEDMSLVFRQLGEISPKVMLLDFTLCLHIFNSVTTFLFL